MSESLYHLTSGYGNVSSAIAVEPGSVGAERMEVIQKRAAVIARLEQEIEAHPSDVAVNSRLATTITSIRETNTRELLANARATHAYGEQVSMSAFDGATEDGIPLHEIRAMAYNSPINARNIIDGRDAGIQVAEGLPNVLETIKKHSALEVLREQHPVKQSRSGLRGLMDNIRAGKKTNVYNLEKEYRERAETANDKSGEIVAGLKDNVRRNFSFDGRYINHHEVETSAERIKNEAIIADLNWQREVHNRFQEKVSGSKRGRQVREIVFVEPENP